MDKVYITGTYNNYDIEKLSNYVNVIQDSRSCEEIS